MQSPSVILNDRLRAKCYLQLIGLPSMGLPNLSYMMKVGQLRHIQANYEAAIARNPDDLVGHFLTPTERLGCAIRGSFLIDKLRSDPFYYYVLARTRYYDEIFLDSLSRDVKFVLNIGCGGDTRAHRWREQLVGHGCAMVECDQQKAIERKEVIARRSLHSDHVRYLAIDLNDKQWPALAQWLATVRGQRGFVMMEGVSPYIDHTSFTAFLALLAREMTPGSEIAYDYKIAGVADAFGEVGRGTQLFRLVPDGLATARFHAALGLDQTHHELGSALVERFIAQDLLNDRPRFREDALIRSRVGAIRT